MPRNHMKLFKNTLASAVLGMALAFFGLLQPANAESVAFSSTLTNVNFLTLSGSTISLQAFDSSLGTLESVTISLSGTMTQSSVTITTGDGVTVLGSSTVASDIGLSLTSADAGSVGSVDLLTGDATVGSTINSNSSKVVSTGVASDSSSTDLAASTYWETSGGSSTVALTLSTGYSLAPNTLKQVGAASVAVTSATGGAVVTVTYNYTPTTVPEPATWAIMFGGLGVLFAVQRVRRKSA